MHLNDLAPSPVLTGSDLTFGYQHTVDTINVRTNENFAGFPFMQSARASMTTDAAYAGITTTVWKRVVVTGQLRQDWIGVNAPTTWRLGSVLLAPESAPRSRWCTAPHFVRRPCSNGTASISPARLAIRR